MSWFLSVVVNCNYFTCMGVYIGDGYGRNEGFNIERTSVQIILP